MHEAFLEVAKGKVNMQDAVKFYEADSEGRLLALNIRKVEENSRGSMAESLDCEAAYAATTIGDETPAVIHGALLA